MKKWTAIALLLALLAGLCACAGGAADQPEETAAPTEQPASETNTEPVNLEPPASETDAVTVDTTAYETAQEYIGRSVEELYEAVGEPTSSQYASSCEVEDAEDGMLFYEEGGFYIWSVRTADEELVRAVYLDA